MKGSPVENHKNWYVIYVGVATRKYTSLAIYTNKNHTLFIYSKSIHLKEYKYCLRNFVYV